jgi:TolA-binding protein
MRRALWERGWWGELVGKWQYGLRVGLLGVLLALTLQTIPGQSQEAPPELAFAKKLYADGLYLLAAEQYRDFALTNPTSPLAAQAKFMVGESFFARDDLDLAAEAYREFLAGYPQSNDVPQAWFRLGICLSHAGHFSDAAAAFSRSQRMEPEGPWASMALFGMADALRSAGELDRALEEFDVFVESYPQSHQAHQAHIARGEILVALGQWNGAQAAFRAAGQRANSPEDLAKARLQEGRVLVLKGDEKRALDLLSQLVEEGASSIYADSALVLLGDLYRDRGEYRKAAENYGALDSGGRTDVLAELAGFREAESLYLAADHEGAVSAYRRWLARYPLSSMAPEVKLGFSRSLMALEDPDSAAAVLEELTQEAGEAEWGPQAWKESGNAEYKRGKPRRALDAYQEFLRRYPHSPQADSLYFRTAQILEVDLNRPQAAQRIYRTFSSLYPQSPFADDADFALGHSHEVSGEYDQALQAYRTFVQEYPLSPLYPQAQERIAYLNAYRVPDERSALEELMNVQDRQASGSLEAEEVDLSLGEIYFRHLKDFSKAITALERFIGKNPESPLLDQALFQLGECHRARAAMWRIEGDSTAVVQAQRAAAETCRRLLQARPHSAWADQCALEIIADVLRDGGSQSGSPWLGQVGLYSSFLGTYANSPRRGYAYLQIGRAYLELAAQDQSFLAKSDSVFSIILEQHSHSPWADTAAWRRIGIAQWREDEVGALELCQDFLDAFPQSELKSQVLFVKAQIHSRRLEHRQAAELFRSVGQDVPYHAHTEEALLRWAESLWVAGDARGARRALEEFEARYPESPLRSRAMVLLAQDLVEKAKHQQAQALLLRLEKIVSENAPNDELQLALGDLYLATGSHPKALSSYQALVRDFPGSRLVGAALERTAHAYFGNQNFAEAQAYYERALDETLREDRRPYLESKRIICLYRLGHFQEALAARKEFEKGHADQTDLLAELLVEEGGAYEGQGEERAARNSFETVLKRYEDSQYALEAEYRLGLMDLKGGDFSGALARFQTLVENHPQSPWQEKTLFKMGSALYALERYDEAAQSYERVARQARETGLIVDALFNAGICRGKMNDWEGALAAYERLVQDFPNYQENQKWSLRLGFVYLQAGRPARALKTFEQIDTGKDAELGAEVQFWLGECFFHMEEYEKAAQEYLRVSYLYPLQDQWAVTGEYNAAVSYEKLGREEEARSIYRKLVTDRGPADQWGAAAQERLDELGD